MGFLAAIKQLAYSLLVAICRIACLLSGHAKLHSARFASFHELAGLTVAGDNQEASLMLGQTYLGNTLAVRPTRARRELGNLLIVAPTRGGKGLLGTSTQTWCIRRPFDLTPAAVLTAVTATPLHQTIPIPITPISGGFRGRIRRSCHFVLPH